MLRQSNGYGWLRVEYTAKDSHSLERLFLHMGFYAVARHRSNEEYDEVLFYHRGEVFSNDNIYPGMLILHPAGITHVPHPKVFELGKKAAPVWWRNGCLKS